jgi:hypothetical protein
MPTILLTRQNVNNDPEFVYYGGDSFWYTRVGFSKMAVLNTTNTFVDWSNCQMECLLGHSIPVLCVHDCWVLACKEKNQ